MRTQFINWTDVYFHVCYLLWKHGREFCSCKSIYTKCIQIFEINWSYLECLKCWKWISLEIASLGLINLLRYYVTVRSIREDISESKTVLWAMPGKPLTPSLTKVVLFVKNKVKAQITEPSLKKLSTPFPNLAMPIWNSFLLSRNNI